MGECSSSTIAHKRTHPQEQNDLQTLDQAGQRMYVKLQSYFQWTNNFFLKVDFVCLIRNLQTPLKLKNIHKIFEKILLVHLFEALE